MKVEGEVSGAIFLVIGRGFDQLHLRCLATMLKCRRLIHATAGDMWPPQFCILPKVKTSGTMPERERSGNRGVEEENIEAAYDRSRP